MMLRIGLTVMIHPVECWRHEFLMFSRFPCVGNNIRPQVALGQDAMELVHRQVQAHIGWSQSDSCNYLYTSFIFLKIYFIFIHLIYTHIYIICTILIIITYWWDQPSSLHFSLWQSQRGLSSGSTEGAGRSAKGSIFRTTCGGW
jgi:hypothetical protein